MNRRLTTFLCGFLAAVLILVGVIFGGRELQLRHRQEGERQGYMVGYIMGYTDGTQDLRAQDTQLLAGRLEPYGIGSTRWKGFMLEFPTGYEKGYEDGQNRRISTED